MDIELKQYLDDNFTRVVRDITEIRQDVKSLFGRMSEQSEELICCKKDIEKLDIDLNDPDKGHITATRIEFDKVWNKNRAQDDCLQKVKSRLVYYAGGIAAIVFITGIIIAILGLILK